MAFFNKAGSILRQSLCKTHVSRETLASSPSIFQVLRFMSTSKVFIGGLSYSTDDNSLREAFVNYGEVTEARVVVDRETGRSRGFGFVTYTSPEEASSAIQALDGKELHGRMVRVNYANERPRSGGFGGGGYGGGGYGGGGYGGGGYGGGGYGGGSSYGGGGGSGGYGGAGGYGGGGSVDGSSGSGYGGGGSYGTGGGNFSGGYGGGSNVGYGNDVQTFGADDGSSFGSAAGAGGDGYNPSPPSEGNFRDDDAAEPDGYANRGA